MRDDPDDADRNHRNVYPVEAVKGIEPQASAMPSSVIRDFQYRPGDRRLDIHFVSGRHYRYYDVPPEIFDAMKRSLGKGEYFNARIRDHFRFTRE